MLDLDDPRWTELSHAYGRATDIPVLLRQLANEPWRHGSDSQPWTTLWSSLCHQGDVFTASYAAIPHMMEIALATARPLDFSYFSFPASVEVARSKGRGPEVPSFLQADYQRAILRMLECSTMRMGEDWSEDLTIAIIAAIAVAKGHHAVAEAVMNFDADLIAMINSGEWMR